MNDMNIDNYTNEELLDIVNLTDNSTLQEIEQKFDTYIEHYILHNNNEYVYFLNDAKLKLLKINDLEDNNIEGFDNNDDPDTNPDDINPNPDDTNPNPDDINSNPDINPNPDINQNPDYIDQNLYNPDHYSSFIIKPNDPIRPSVVRPDVNPDNLNPILKQTITKYITINSQYRLNSYPYNFDPYSTKGVNTNFTCSLTDTLNNVLSLQLYSIYIPETWYTFDTYIGNTIFWIYYASTAADFSNNNNNINCYKIEIMEGTYKLASELVAEINSAIQKCTAKYTIPHTIDPTTGVPSATYDLSGLCCCIKDPTSTNSRIGFINYTNFYIKIYFWPKPLLPSGCVDFSGNPQYNDAPCLEVTSYQQNLGYYLGMRILDVPNAQASLIQWLAPLQYILDPSSSVSNNWANTLKTQYFAAVNSINDIILINPINDISLSIINQTTINALILSGLTTDISMSPGWPGAFIDIKNGGKVSNNFYTVAPLLGGSQYFQLILDDFNKNYHATNSIGIAQENNKLDLPNYNNAFSPTTSADISSAFLYCSDPSTNTSIFLPTFPRNLTQAQLYSLNEIVYNRKSINIIKNVPVISNLFATIYIADAPTSTNKTITIINNNIMEKRTYFGPTTLQRLQIKLVDSRGNIVNLHGSNWSFTLVVEVLYQY